MDTRMQSFNFALRQSTADSADDNRSRYVPSSIYSGPGPAEESPLPPHPVYLHNGSYGTNGVNGSRNTYQSTSSNPYAQSVRSVRPRHSVPLNTNDPVVMHLLAETALIDSKDYEILSFGELEQLKKDKSVLQNRIDATKRKIALECKLRDAAKSLNRLHSKISDNTDPNESNPKNHSRNPDGSKNSTISVLSTANDEYRASSQRIEQLTTELKKMETRREDGQRRVLEHTAGILQLTHKGLKKNSKKSELPRSPESMTSRDRRSVPVRDQLDEFDERSLYPIPDYVHEFAQSTSVTPMMPSRSKFEQAAPALDGISNQLQALSVRMHDMARRLNPSEEVVPPPEPVKLPKDEIDSDHINGQLVYLSQNLDAIDAGQQLTLVESDNVNAQIHKMLEKTKSVGHSPLVTQDEPRGPDVTSQLAFSTRVLEQLHARVETLVGQKDILTRQITQQRELNTKSDAQRDAQIQDLTEELEDCKRLQTTAEQEAQESQNQIEMLIEQLDRSKQDAMLVEQQRGMNESNALRSERSARQAAEKQLLEDIATKQQAYADLQADMAKTQNEFELRSQQHIQSLNEALTAKEAASIEAKRHQSEADKLLEQMAALQTELTITKAELDGAYGTRAQRAADVSLNPAIQKEIDSLNSRNVQLQTELKDTIEDYEQMTKASIEFEKERDRFEALIDTLREKGESLESQLQEEKLKWLGVKAQAPTETTSTMVLKNEFKKMMRDTRAENLKVLKAEQEERRRLEGLIRSMRKEAGMATPAKSTAGSRLPTEPTTPSMS